MGNEAAIRLGVFLGLLALFGVLEAAAPRRARVMPRGGRWLTNLSISAINTGMLRLMALAVPLLAVGAAADAAALGWGVLNHLGLPGWVEFGLAILILDLTLWAQHLITHKVPVLWRFHRVHHADRDMDVTTGVRFHPVEIAASMGVKIAVIYALGPSALAVLVFEVLLNGTSLFNHANLALPLRVERAIRMVLVTPDMHRIHHSVHRAEHDRNFGFALSVWDRLFGTYLAAPGGGQEGMTVGLAWQDARPARLGWSLALPFRK